MITEAERTTVTAACPATTPSDARDSGGAPAPRWAPAVLLVAAVLGEAWAAAPWAGLPVLVFGLAGLYLVGSLVGPCQPVRARPSDVDIHGPLAPRTRTGGVA